MRSSIGNYDDDDDDEKKTTERDGDGKTAANETTAENNNATNAREVFDKALSKKLTTMPRLKKSSKFSRKSVLWTRTDVQAKAGA